jgi:hypothetical protein
MANKEIKLGLYQHYRGNLYRVMGVCRHSETLEELIVYQALYGDYGLWVRPKSMFFDVVDVEGKNILRFTYTQALFEHAPKLR